MSSCAASISLSTDPKCAARLRAVTHPVWGMFSPNRTRLKGRSFDASMAATALPAEISP
jgi:hypothetical protein